MGWLHVRQEIVFLKQYWYFFTNPRLEKFTISVLFLVDFCFCRSIFLFVFCLLSVSIFFLPYLSLFYLLLVHLCALILAHMGRYHVRQDLVFLKQYWHYYSKNLDYKIDHFHVVFGRFLFVSVHFSSYFFIFYSVSIYLLPFLSSIFLF